MSRLQKRIRLQRAEYDFDRGRISLEEFNAIKSECVPAVKKISKEVPVSTVQVGFAKDEDTPKLSDSVKAYLADLKGQLDSILQQKDALCNQNVKAPPELNTKGLVDQIMDLRSQMIELKAAIFKCEKTGEIPDVNTELVVDDYYAGLPNDRYSLDRLIKNLKINISKDLKKAQTVKTDVKRNLYLTKVTENRKKLEVMQQKFSNL